MHKASITNVAVGRLIGLTHSGVSRLRSGTRSPSFRVMFRVEREFGWSFSDQAKARASGRWHVDFEQALVNIYGVADVSASA